MQNEPFTHKVADVIHQSWPFLVVMGTVFVASIKMWWSEKKQTKNRIKTLEVLAENMVTKAELQSCRDDVRAEDNSNIEKIYKEIKDNNRHNAEQFQDIMKEIIRIHSGDKQ